MRITGLAIALIGVVIAAFCGVTTMYFKAPSENEAVMFTERRAAPDLTLPMVIAGVAVVAGGAVYLYGGRGFFEKDNPGLPPPAVQG